MSAHLKLASLLLLLFLPFAPALAQETASAAQLPELDWTPPPLEPFTATYEAYYQGKLAGDATMQVVHTDGPRWRIDMAVHGKHGFASVLGLNIEQSTVFESHGKTYFPLSQSTVKKALFFGKKVVGSYNWPERIAQWEGDIKDKRQQPIHLKLGDQSALLLNLSIMRDAVPGADLHYRYVDVGRVRQHDYHVAEKPEGIEVDGIRYQALRVFRTNGGDDETILWIANGVPTPVRILQRKHGEDRIDLRLIAYKGA